MFVFREGEGEREGQNVNQLLLAQLQPGTWLTTQACALTCNWTGWPFSLQDDAQPTEPHQWGQQPVIFAVYSKLISF